MAGDWREGESEEGADEHSIFLPVESSYHEAGCAPKGKPQLLLGGLLHPAFSQILLTFSALAPFRTKDRSSSPSPPKYLGHCPPFLWFPSALLLVNGLLAKSSTDFPVVLFVPAQTLTHTQVLRYSHST